MTPWVVDDVASSPEREVGLTVGSADRVSHDDAAGHGTLR
jgi:hypothetical protein